jgi:hypothetical protein
MKRATLKDIKRPGQIKVLEMIIEDMRENAIYYDGTGKHVAESFEKQGAAIAGLAKIVKSLIMERR